MGAAGPRTKELGQLQKKKKTFQTDHKMFLQLGPGDSRQGRLAC